MSSRHTRVASWLVALALTTGGCVTPAFNSGAFKANGEAAVSSALSQTRTGALVVRSRLDDRATRRYADVVVTDSESAMSPIQDSYGSVDPPSPSDDRQRDQVMSLLGDAADALAAARIAVRRDDPAQMRAAVKNLDDVSHRLEQAKQALQ